jgi:hypothetical protein
LNQPRPRNRQRNATVNATVEEERPFQGRVKTPEKGPLGPVVAFDLREKADPFQGTSGTLRRPLANPKLFDINILPATY